VIGGDLEFSTHRDPTRLAHLTRAEADGGMPLRLGLMIEPGIVAASLGLLFRRPSHCFAGC